MSQNSSDKYIYFTVGLLKGSDALDALRADAVKHHMIDYPGQLIALRLTEYYQMMNQGITQPVIKVPAILAPLESEQTPDTEIATTHTSGTFHMPTSTTPTTTTSPFEMPTPSPFQASGESRSSMQQVTGRMRALTREEDAIVSASTNADQNADDAADYWSML
jgi:hypothetical protein